MFQLPAKLTADKEVITDFGGCLVKGQQTVLG